jgi:hypothetical protein
MDIRTSTFQKARESFENLVKESPEVRQDETLQDNFLRQQGIDPTEFFSAYKQYDDERKAGVTDFRPLSDAGAFGVAKRFAGRTSGEVLGAVQDLTKTFTGVDLKQNIKNVASTVFGEEPTDAVLDEAERFLDPYHGDGLLGEAEDIGGKVASFFVGFGPVLKGIQYGSKALLGGSRLAAPLSKTLPGFKNLTYGNVAGGIGAAALTETALTDQQEYALEKLKSIPEGEQLLQELENNPENPQLQMYADELLKNLGYETAFAGGFAGLLGAKKLFDRTKVGQTVSKLGSKYFSSRRGLDDGAFNIVLKRDNEARGALEEANGYADDLKNIVKKEVKGGNTPFAALPTDQRDELLNLALAGDSAAINALSPEMRNIVQEMVDKKRLLSDHLGNNVFKGALSYKFLNNDVVLTRSYKIYDDLDYSSKVKEAFEDYRMGKNLSDPEMQQNLDNVANVLRAKFPNATSDEILGKLSELAFVNNKEKDAFFDILTGKAGGGAFAGTAKSAMKRQDIDPALRALWGEVKDPFVNYTKTYVKLADMKAEHDFMSDIANHFVGTNQVIRQSAAQGRGDLRSLALEHAKGIFSPQAAEKYIQNPVAKGIYIDPNYYDALKDFNNYDNLPSFLNVFAAAKGASQLAKTAYNPGTHGRNVMGNMTLLAANGMNPFFGKGFSPAFQTVFSKLKGMSNKDLGMYLGELERAGVISSSVQANTMRRNLQSVSDISKFTNKLTDNTATKLYEGEDSLFKIVHYERTKDYLRKAFPNLTQKEIGDMAAQRTRDLMPNYAMIPRAIQSLRALPIGNFVGFASEIARVSKNLIKYSLDDLASGNQELRSAALKRLAGTTFAGGLLPEILESVSAQIYGITDEEVEAIKAVDKPYFKGSNQVFLSPIKENKERGTKEIDRVMLGSIDPFDSVRTAAKALHSAIGNFSGDKPETEKITKQAALAMADRVLSPFVGPSMVTNGLISLSSGDPEQLRIYPDSTALGASIKGLARILDIDPESTPVQAAATLGAVFDPGFATLIRQRYQFEEAKAKQLGVPVSEAIFMDRTGREISDYDSALNPSLFLDIAGAKKNTLDLTSNTRSILQPILKDIDTSGDKFKEAITRRNLLPEDFPEVDKILKRDFKSDVDKKLLLKEYTEMFKRLGLTEEDIARGFSRQGRYPLDKLNRKQIDEIRSAYNDMYSPFELSEDTINMVRTLNPQYDFKNYIDLYSDLKKTPLTKIKDRGE